MPHDEARDHSIRVTFRFSRVHQCNVALRNHSATVRKGFVCPFDLTHGPHVRGNELPVCISRGTRPGAPSTLMVSSQTGSGQVVPGPELTLLRVSAGRLSSGCVRMRAVSQLPVDPAHAPSSALVPQTDFPFSINHPINSPGRRLAGRTPNYAACSFFFSEYQIAT